ncbi:MAG TPA: glucokinase [Desulfatiglandales bacterium]|nr:glucokinase [Desulfatiglandales bacterium]
MTTKKRERVVLAGDIGGTKTNIGLYVTGKKRPVPLVVESFASREAAHLENIVDRFLERHPAAVSSACFGIAGPVINGRCKATNLPWVVSEARLKRHFHWRHARLLNDLAATALAIPLLRRSEWVPLNKGITQKNGNVALLSPGTGLGQAMLVYKDGKYVPVASEGGHVGFSPTTEQEIDLWRYLRNKFDHVSIERVLSGPGLVNVYAWLRDSHRYEEPDWLKDLLKREDPAKAISESAFRKKQGLCVESLRLYVSMLGSAAGNLALTSMAVGGIFLGGGIPPKILPALKQGAFLKAFTAKGRFAHLLARIPVRVIVNDKAALLGAAQAAFETVEANPSV